MNAERYNSRITSALENYRLELEKSLLPQDRSMYHDFFRATIALALHHGIEVRPYTNWWDKYCADYFIDAAHPSPDASMIELLIQKLMNEQDVDNIAFGVRQQ